MLRMAHRIATTPAYQVTHVNFGPNIKNNAREKYAERIAVFKNCKSYVIADNVEEYFKEWDNRNDSWDAFPQCVPFTNPMFIEFGNYAVCAEVYRPEPNDEHDYSEYGGVLRLSFWSFACDKLCLMGVEVRCILRLDGCIHHEDTAPTVFFDNEPNPEFKKYAAHLQGWYCTRIALLAMSFSNCKNVTRKDVTESEGPSAKWIRRQKAPEIRYHVLDINPMKEVLRAEGNIEANGLKKALHICRGHFAHYPQGLFGRGEPCTVYRPSHVRGHAEQGVVLKDYRIKTD